MHLLPLNLASLSAVADTRVNSRFAATQGIRLELHGDNTFLAEATDGRRALRVSGPCGDASEYPVSDAMQAAPNGEIEGSIPATAWKASFASAAKLIKKGVKPSLRNVAVKIGKNVVSLSSTNLDQTTFDQPRQIDGRFPAIAQVIPAANKAFATFNVDPAQFSDTLDTMAKLGATKVVVELHNANKQVAGLLALRAELENGQKIEGAQVPLTLKSDEKSENADEETPDLAAEIAALKAERNKLLRDNSDLQLILKGQAEKIADLEHVANERREQILRLKAKCDHRGEQLDRIAPNPVRLSRRDRLAAKENA